MFLLRMLFSLFLSIFEYHMGSGAVFLSNMMFGPFFTMNDFENFQSPRIDIGKTVDTSKTIPEFVTPQENRR